MKTPNLKRNFIFDMFYQILTVITPLITAPYLTLLFFMGVFCCNYIIITKEVKLRYMISQIIFLSAMFITGRTGLYASFILILITGIIFVINKNKLRQALFISIIMMILGVIAFYIIQNSMTQQQFYRLFNRFIMVFRNINNDRSISALA